MCASSEQQHHNSTHRPSVPTFSPTCPHVTANILHCKKNSAPIVKIAASSHRNKHLLPIEHLVPSEKQFVPIANKPTCSQIPFSRTKYYYQPVHRSHCHAQNTITTLFTDPTVKHQILLPTCSQIPLSRTKYYYHFVNRSHCHAPNTITNLFTDPIVTHKILLPPCSQILLLRTK